MYTAISIDVPGAEIANELLLSVHAGQLPIDEVRQWLRELRDEGLAAMASAVERRLPPDMAPPLGCG